MLRSAQLLKLIAKSFNVETHKATSQGFGFVLTSAWIDLYSQQVKSIWEKKKWVRSGFTAAVRFETSIFTVVEAVGERLGRREAVCVY